MTILDINNNKALELLENYLYEHYSQEKEHISHVSIYNPKGSYSINNKFELFAIINKYISASSTHYYCIAEKPKEEMPIIADIDIKMKVHDNSDLDSLPKKTLYSPNFVQKLILLFWKTLEEKLEEYNHDDFACVFLEKPPYIDRKNKKNSTTTYLKHGFHLHFPTLFVKKEEFKLHILPAIRDSSRAILDIIRYNKTSAPSGIDIDLDTNICCNAWLLYKACKGFNCQPYSICAVVYPPSFGDYEPRKYEKIGMVVKGTDEAGLDKYINNIYSRYISSNAAEKYLPSSSTSTSTAATAQLYKLLCVFSIHREKQPLYRVKPEIIEEYNNIMKVDAVFDSKDDDLLPLVEVTSKEKSMSREDIMKESIDHILNITPTLISLLSKERAEERNDWIKVGWTLFNVYRSNPTQGLNLWIEFSKRAEDKFESGVCEKEWSKMRLGDLSIGTLKYMAKIDNEVKYKELMNTSLEARFTNSIYNINHVNFARLLDDLYGEEYKCAYIGNTVGSNIWYQFSNGIWKCIGNGTEMRVDISGRFSYIYEIMKNNLEVKLKRIVNNNNNSEDSNSIKEKDSLEFQLSQLTTILNKYLKNTSQKKNIMAELADILIDRNFMRLLDANKHLIAFKNGVFDLNEMTLRSGTPDDRLSCCMEINYQSDYSINHPDVIELLKFLKEVLADKEVRHYFLNINSEIFYGGNSRKIVQLWVGCGNNSKSVMLSLFEIMLGEYAKKLPTSILTTKRSSSSAATPELARVGQGCRLVSLQEAAEEDHFNVSVVKELSGNDRYYCRPLFKEGFEVNPQFKLIMATNELPTIVGKDTAIYNRFRVIRFSSLFDDEAPEDYEEQVKHRHFKANPMFAEKILPRLAPALAWLLLEIYKANKNQKDFTTPESVINDLKAYQNKNNACHRFIEENMVYNPSIKTEELPSCAVILKEFKNWVNFVNFNRSMQQLPSTELINLFCIEFNKINKDAGRDPIQVVNCRGKKYFPGWTINTSEDKEEDRVVSPKPSIKVDDIEKNFAC